MSVFTNPSSRSVEQARAYTAAILDLLGTREPLSVLGRTTAELKRRFEGRTAGQLVEPEAPGKWSVRHVLQHLADSEAVWAWRVRLVIAQDRPPLTGYDQDLWAERLHYDAADAHEALQEFAALREMNLRLLRRLPPDGFMRVGVHAERGEESVELMMRLYAGHDLLHLRQIDRILQGLPASGTIGRD